MRRILLLFGGLISSAVLALLALPWWLPSLLKAAGPRWGLSFATYERVGYARLALREVVYTHPVVRVTVDRVETDTPVLYLWRLWTGGARVVTATRWEVTATPRPAVAGAAPSPGGALRLRTTLTRVAAQLDRWLPFAEVGAGKVTWPGGGLTIASARWQQRTVQVRELDFGALAAEVTAAFLPDAVITLGAVATDKAWQANLKQQGDETAGEIRLWEQTASVRAKWAEYGWLPDSAVVRAATWSVPAANVKLGQFYTVLRGDGHLDWKQGRFETAVDIEGEAVAGQAAPPLHVKLRGQGDTERLSIGSLEVEAPGVTASLSAPIEFERKGGLRSGVSVFAVAVNLAEQPWFTARGNLTGEARLTPWGSGVPRIEVRLAGRDWTWREWSGLGGSAEATLEWPRLQVKTAKITLNPSDTLTGQGGWDFQAKELLDSEIAGTLSRAAVARWWPAEVGLGGVTLTGKAHGPLAALQHEGTAQASALTVRGLHPLALEVAWRGTGAAVQVSEAKVRAGAAVVTLAGSVDRSGAQVSDLRFSQGGVERLALVRPARVRWSPGLEVGPLQLAGPEGALAVELAWGGRGRVDVTAKNIPSSWGNDFVANAGPEWRVVSLAAQGQWDGGPMTFAAESELEIVLAPGRTAAAHLSAHGDAGGVIIDAMRIAEGPAPIFTVTGRLPLHLQPGGAAPLVRFDEAAPLELHAITTSNPEFWRKLSEASGLEFVAPEITAEVTGSWARPQGEVTARVVRVATDGKRLKWPWPKVENLELHAIGDRAGVTVDRLKVTVDGQMVRASGRLPLSPVTWAEFRRDPLTFVRREGNLQLEVPDAEVAALAHYLPAWLTPAGRWHLQATLKPGGDMEGSFRLQGAVSRPVGPLGVLQEINAEVRLNGRAVEVQSVSAQTGGQPVKLTGTIQLPLGAAPRYDLTLQGKNLPLIRQAGLILRADLDLKLVTPADGVPAVTGAVKLRESVFLSDVRALIPSGGGNGPTRRPPYFAISEPPLDAWRLAVEVRGDEFMRLRSTAFVGVASARFRLTGTLGDPRATGEAVVNQGQVVLPFATFEVVQGAVRLSEAEPHTLGLLLTGTARRYGYDLQMDLTGTVAKPVVTFSSSPPLDAKQVLLLVMAGEMPHNEVAVGAGQRAARLGAYLGQSLISSFGGDHTDASRLSIVTGERVSQQGRETYDVEYTLNDRFSLVGEYDEFDGFNAGLKWRFLGPETPPIEKKAPAEPEKKEEVR